jgi:pilus assembly protein CpaD
MTHCLRFAPALVAALIPALLGGCAEMDREERLLTYSGWRQMDVPPQPRVEQIPVRHVVQFLPGADIMTATDRVALASFLAGNGIGRGAQVAVATVNPGPDSTRVAARLEAVSSTLNRMGVATVSQPPTMDAGAAQSDAVLVVAYKLAVLPQECPGYTTPVMLDEANRPVFSWGCSTAANLGLMVEDPRDLLDGRDLAPADGEAARQAIQRYRGIQRPNAVFPPEREDTSGL